MPLLTANIHHVESVLHVFYFWIAFQYASPLLSTIVNI